MAEEHIFDSCLSLYHHNRALSNKAASIISRGIEGCVAVRIWRGDNDKSAYSSVPLASFGKVRGGVMASE